MRSAQLAQHTLSFVCQRLWTTTTRSFRVHTPWLSQATAANVVVSLVTFFTFLFLLGTSAWAQNTNVNFGPAQTNAIGGNLTFNLVVGTSITGNATLNVTNIYGDLNSNNEVVTIFADGVVVGTFGGFGGRNCTNGPNQIISIPQATLQPLIADGALTLTFDANNRVDFCTVAGSGRREPPNLRVGGNLSYPGATPQFTVTKTPNVANVDEDGDVITYAIAVANTGNVTLTGLTITDPLTGDEACPVATLAPMASTNCTASYTVQQSDIDGNGIDINGAVDGDGDIDNTVTIDTDQTAPQTALAAVMIGQNPAFTVTKTADVASVDSDGDVITYAIAVANTGNVTLTGLTITDPLTGDEACPVATLAPMASTNCTASYTVQQSDIDGNGIDTNGAVDGDGDIDNTVTIDTDQTAPQTALAAVMIGQNPAFTVTKTADVASVDSDGDVITYAIAVANTGNVTLTGLTIADPLTGDEACTVASLAPMASTNCTASYTVQQSDIDGNGIDINGAVDGDGDIDNTVTIDTDQTAPQTALAAVMIGQNPAFTVTKTADVASVDSDGDVITYAIAVANTGNVTLTGLTIADPLTGDEACPVATLAPMASTNCTASYTVQQSDIDGNGIDTNGAVDGDGDIDNTVTIDTDQTAPQTATETVSVTQNPVFSVTKTADVTSVDSDGDVITYTIAVANTGNVTLTGLTIADPLTGDEACTVASLAPMASTNCTASYTVQQADIDGNGIDINGAVDGDGDIDNTVTIDTDQTAPQTASETVAVAQNAALTVTKTADVTSVDSDGDVITYTIAVANTGNVTLTGLTIADPLTGDEACTVASLAPMASTNCTASYTVQQADIDGNGIDINGAVDGDGDIDNTASVSTDQTGPQTASETVAISQNADFTVTKTADVASVDSDGDVITYTIAVANTGNVTLTGLTITDPLTGDEACPVASLAPMASTNCTASYTVQQSDIDGNGIDTNGAVDGDGDIDNTVTIDTDQTAPQTATETVSVTQNPVFSVTKTADVTSVDSDGDVITYTIAVANTGNVTLTGLTIADPLTGDEACTVASLAPMASTNCTASYTVQQADIDGNGIDINGAVDGDGDIDNTVTIDTDQTAPQTASETVAVAQNAALTVTKTADVTSVDSDGDVITYTIAVANTGNVTLTGLTIADPLTGDEACPVASLAPMAATNCTASYTVQQADIDGNGIDINGAVDGDGDIDNTVTIDTDQTAPQTASETVSVTQNPVFSVTKTADVAFVDTEGDVITYAIAVTNAGNVTLTGLTIADPLTGDEACPVATLAPMASTNCTASYTVQQSDIDGNGIDTNGAVDGDGDIDNTVTIDTDQTAPQTASEIVAISQNADFTVTKTADLATIDSDGDVITYTIAVTNTGNVTLTGLTIADPLTGDEACPVATLAPMASTNCTASYTVQQADIDGNGIDTNGAVDGDGDIDNTVTIDTDQTAPQTATETVSVTQNPVFSVTKMSDVAAVENDGDVITYTIAITNTGNVTLTGLTIADPLTGDEACPVVTLAPLASTNCTATYTVQQSDIDGNGIDTNGAVDGDGDIDNTVTIDTDQTGPQSASETVGFNLSPALSVTKTADVTSVDAEGEVITYTIALTNTGNITLTGLTIDDPLTGDEACPVTSLIPSASTSCTATYTVQQSDIDNNGIDTSGAVDGDGDIDNTVTVDTNQTAPVVASETVNIARNVAFTVGKTADIAIVSKDGDVITYTIAVTNIGNVTLSGIAITDTLTADEACPVASLAPLVSTNCTATYTVQQSDIDGNGIDTNGAVDGDGDIDNTVTVNTDQAPAQMSSETVAITQSPSLTVTKTANLTTVSSDGDVISYTIAVTNTGNLTLTGLTIADPLTGDEACPVATLAPMAATNCTASYTVQQADIDGNGIDINGAVDGDSDIDNTVTIDTDQTAPQTASETVAIGQNATFTVTKSADLSSVSSDGDVISYTIAVTNTGNVTLTGLTIADPLTGDEACPVATLAPMAATNCTASYTVQQADIDGNGIDTNGAVDGDSDIDNTVTIDTDQTAPQTASETVSIGQNAAFTVTKSADLSSVSSDGDVISYTIAVTNTGNVTLTGLTIADPLTGDEACPVATLAPMAATNCTASYTVQQADIDGNGIDINGAVDGDSDIDNTVTIDTDQTAPQTASETVAIGQNATFTVTKSADLSSVSSDGDVISYTIAVTNTGNVTLTGLTIADPLTGDEACPVATLAPMAATNCTASYTVQQADIDGNGIDTNGAVDGDSDIDNTVTIDTDQTAPQTASETVSIGQNAAFTVTKSADLSSVSSDGDVISYTIAVTNTGNVTLTGLTIADPLTGDEACPVATLAPMAATNCTASYTVQQADIDGNGIDINGAVDGDSDIDNTVTIDTDQTAPQTASETVAIGQNATFTVTKSADLSSVSSDGDVISYTIAVTNTGNVTLTGLTIADPLTGDEACPVATLAPMAATNCTASYTVQQADIDGNGIDTNGAVDGDSDIDNTVTIDTDQTAPQTASETVSIGQNAAFTVTKSADLSSVSSDGDVISYTIAVTNTGNITLTGLTIADPLTGDEACPVATLAPMAATNCTATYTVQQSDIDNNGIDTTGAVDGDGDIDNLVTIDTDQTGPQTAYATVSVGQSASIVVNKTADVATVDADGDVISYTIAVTNTGNVMLTGLTIADPLTGDEACPVATLAPMASTNCTASYTVQQSDIDGNGIDTNGAIDGDSDIDNTVTIDTDQTAPQTASETVAIEQFAGVVVTKSTSNADFSNVGDIIPYEIVIQNTGSVTLTSITLTDPLTNDESCPSSSLASGGTMTCTATLSVTASQLLAREIVNVARVTTAQAAPRMSNPVTLRLNRAYARNRTLRAINNFLARRADQITASDPDLANRLNAGCGNGKLPQVSGNGSDETSQFRVSGSLRDSLRHGDNEPQRECPKFDIWMQGQWGTTKADQGRQDLGLLYIGADYRLSPGLVFGVLAQFDWSNEEDAVEKISAKGFGWMVGPYLVARLDKNLIFDTRIAWGQSTNKINPLGVYEDEFKTNRWLARARLTGNFDVGGFNFTPHVGILYFEEQQKAYVDSLGTYIPGQTINLGRVTFGPKVSFRVEGPDNMVLVPHFGVTGIWDFEKAEIVDLETGFATNAGSDLRVRVEGGLRIEFPNNWDVQARGFADGIGTDDSETYGGSIRLRIPLN